MTPTARDEFSQTVIFPSDPDKLYPYINHLVTVLHPDGLRRFRLIGMVEPDKILIELCYPAHLQPLLEAHRMGLDMDR